MVYFFDDMSIQSLGLVLGFVVDPGHAVERMQVVAQRHLGQITRVCVHLVSHGPFLRLIIRNTFLFTLDIVLYLVRHSRILCRGYSESSLHYWRSKANTGLLDIRESRSD